MVMADFPSSCASAHQPAILAGSDAHELAKAPREVALVREAGRDGDLSERQIALDEQLLRAPDTAQEEEMTRRHALGSLERTRKMTARQSHQPGEPPDADALLEICLDVRVHPPPRAWRQPAASEHLSFAGTDNRVAQRRQNL